MSVLVSELELVSEPELLSGLAARPVSGSGLVSESSPLALSGLVSELVSGLVSDPGVVSEGSTQSILALAWLHVAHAATRFASSLSPPSHTGSQDPPP